MPAAWGAIGDTCLVPHPQNLIRHALPACLLGRFNDAVD